MKNWVLLRKGGNFTKIGERFHIHPRTAALIRNRDIIGEEAVDRYLNGTIADLYDGMLMKDMDKAVDLLKEKVRASALSGIMTLMASMPHIFFWKGLPALEPGWIMIFQTGSGMATG